MIKAIADTHILKIGFILTTFLFFSCNNEELETSTTDLVTTQLKKDLKLDQFTNKNIAENVIVNWKNVKKIDKDGFEIYEVEIKERIKTKLESNLFQKQLNYVLIAIKSKDETRSYVIEVYSSLKHRSNYPSSLNKLKNFTGTLNVFELNGTPINQVVIIDGKAINPSNNNSIVPLIMGINSFYQPTNLASRLPNCTEVRYIKVEEEMYIDHYDVWKMAATGNVVAINFKNSEYVGTRIYYSNVPYACDEAGDPVHQLQRYSAYSYKTIDEQILVDPTFQSNTCLMGVYNKLGGITSFQYYLHKFDNDFSVADLKLSVGVDSNYLNASAVTYEPINFLIEIKFNPNKLSTPELNIARTFIHETLHAEMYRKLLRLANEGNIPWSADFIKSIKEDYPGLSDYYTRYKYNVPLGQSPSDAQHELMAQHSRGIIIEALKQYDPTRSAEVYNALAWIGLMGRGGEPDKYTGLPPQPTVAWKNLSQAERLQILNIFYNFRDTNQKCQQ